MLPTYTCPVCGKNYKDFDDAMGCIKGHPTVKTMEPDGEVFVRSPGYIDVTMSDGTVHRYGFLEQIVWPEDVQQEERRKERMSRCDTCMYYLKATKMCTRECFEYPGYCVDADKWEPIVEIKKKED